jgi:hypothetical protein
LEAIMVFRQIMSTGAVTTIAATALLAGPTTAQAATSYKACANKQTGQMRLVLKGKKCKKGERKLKWNTAGPPGATGPQGQTGPQGAAGVTGPPGAFDAFDQTGKRIGPLAGLFNGLYPMVRMPRGSILIWLNNPADPNAATIAAPTLYFKQASCAGDAYGVYPGTYPFDLGIVIGTPAAPGKPLYRLTPGTPQAFTSASTLTPAGCAASATAITNAYVAMQDGVVPAVSQPMYFEPAK